MQIRRARTLDIQVLSALCITVWIDTYSTFGIEPAHAEYVLSDYMPDQLATKMNGKDVFVAESEDHHVIGLIIFDPGTSEIETLYVLSRFKGQGVGTALLGCISKQNNNNVHLTCWEENSAALLFYQKQGFIEAGEDYFYLDGQAHRNIRLSLAVTENER